MASDRQAELDRLNAAERKRRATEPKKPPGANWEPRAEEQLPARKRQEYFGFREGIQTNLLRGKDEVAGERRRIFLNE